MKQRYRHIYAGLMTVIYMLITVIPLAPLAISSARVAHALTGECSGDCTLDGCSPESRATRSCCCWQKQQAPTGSARMATGICCDTLPAASPVSKTTCCTTVPGGSVVAHQSCTALSGRHEDTHNDSTVTVPRSQPPATVYKCGCPCGNGKLAALIVLQQEVVPCRGIDAPPPLYERLPVHDPARRLTSRQNEPPDPPPRLSTVS